MQIAILKINKTLKVMIVLKIVLKYCYYWLCFIDFCKPGETYVFLLFAFSSDTSDHFQTLKTINMFMVLICEKNMSQYSSQ